MRVFPTMYTMCILVPSVKLYQPKSNKIAKQLYILFLNKLPIKSAWRMWRVSCFLTCRESATMKQTYSKFVLNATIKPIHSVPTDTGKCNQLTAKFIPLWLQFGFQVLQSHALSPKPHSKCKTAGYFKICLFLCLYLKAWMERNVQCFNISLEFSAIYFASSFSPFSLLLRQLMFDSADQLNFYFPLSKGFLFDYYFGLGDPDTLFVSAVLFSLSLLMIFL